jgi:PST family polysaccharide transporter
MQNRLFKNIGFLTLSQAANYILPLITIPYVTRIVGPENYGLIEFATVAILYFSVIVIYGFNTTATRKIAADPNNIVHVTEVFSTVAITRILLLLFTTILFALSLVLVPALKTNYKLMLFAYPIVIGWAIYPDFLFQGLQRLQFVAVSNFMVKAVAAVLIFVLIQEPDDFYLVLTINAAAQIIVGLLLFLYSFRVVKGLKLIGVSITEILNQLKEGSYVFFSHLFTRIYVFSSVLFLGLMLTEYEMGIYAASFKLIMVAQSFLFLPLSGALFPYLTNLYSSDFELYWKQFKRMVLTFISITLVSAIVLMSAPDFFVKLVFGSNYLEASQYLVVMAPTLIAMAVSHFMLHQGLIIFKKDRIYLYAIVLVGLSSIPVNYFFIQSNGLVGAAWAKVAIEVFLAVISGILFLRVYRAKTLAEKLT